MKLYEERITASPDTMLGKPCIKGTRLTVELILTDLAQGATIEDLLLAYEHVGLTVNDIRAALDYGAELVQREYSSRRLSM
jgi:uncharacterized protein (DUF433 family)